MPTEIRIVLPSPGLEEVLSIADDDELSIAEEIALRECDVIKSNYDLASVHNDNAINNGEDIDGSVDACTTPIPPKENIAFDVREVNNNVKPIPSSPISSNGSSTGEIFVKKTSTSLERNGNGKASHHIIIPKQRRVPINKTSKRKEVLSEFRTNSNGNKNTRALYGRVHCSTQTGDDGCNDIDPNVGQTSLDETEADCKIAENPPIRRRTRRPATASGRLGENRGNKRKPKEQERVKMSVTGTYDLELEHHDIMVKALNSYQQHYRKDSGRVSDKNLADDTVLHINGSFISPRDRESVASSRVIPGASTSTTTKTNPNPNLSPEVKVGRIYDYDCLVAQLWANNFNVNPTYNSHPDGTYFAGSQSQSKKTESQTSSSSSKLGEDGNFRLANCRLIYNDKVKTKRSTRPKSACLSGKSSTSAVDSSGGVLVDSMGHVYGQRKPRPWSALPCKFSSFLKTAASGSEQVKDNKRVVDDHRKSPFQSGQVKIVTIEPPHDAMSQPIARSAAFNRRNQTTFSWADSPSMCQSLPNASFLHKQYTCSPTRIGPPPRSASPTSGGNRAGKPSAAFPQKPSASYSYDGGFFLGAHGGQAGYFVIHPDWVSEAITIKKLGGNKPTEKSFNRKPPQRRWSDNRRCLSAPPPKFRNPITWDANEPIDIPVPIPKAK